MFSLFDVLLIIGVSQGIFISIALQLIQQKNKEANRILSYLLLIACLMLSGRIGWQKLELDWGWRIAILADTTIFLFGPFLYLYIRRITAREKKTFHLGKVHYIFATLHIIYFIWCFFPSTEEYTTLYYSGALKYFLFMIEVVGLVSCFGYWFKSYFFLQKLKRINQDQSSFEPIVFRYANYFLASLLFCFLFWATSVLGYFLPFDYSQYINYDTMWILTPLFFYIVGFFNFTQPQLFRLEISSPKLKVGLKDRLNSSEIERIKKKLEIIMQNDKLFINPELSLSMLAQRLNVSSNDLSWFLNEIHQINFYTFINKHRVSEFVSRIDANEHKKQTILAIAMDVGFNSKSTFNKFFKSIFNQTPSEYIKTSQLAK